MVRVRHCGGERVGWRFELAWWEWVRWGGRVRVVDQGRVTVEASSILGHKRWCSEPDLALSTSELL